MQIRLSEELRERLRKEADRRLVSANLLIERAITILLDRLESEEL